MEDFENEVVYDDEEVVEKKGFFKTVWGWIKSNPGFVITTAVTLGVEAYKQYGRKREYEDYLYVTTDEEEIARIPAKKMRSVKHQSNHKTFRKRKK